MWDRKKIFLAAVCFSALLHTISAGGGKLQESASDVVDDLYRGCSDNAMQRFIYSGLLEQELNDSVPFNTAWLSTPQCTVPKSDVNIYHAKALSAYLNGADYFSTAFDRDVETKGVNVSTYESHFPFKSLHYLLMDAITVLSPKHCQTVFLLQEEDEPILPLKGATVRFGSFTRAFSNLQYLKKNEDFNDRFLLNITSCFFVDFRENTCNQDKYVVLLSPAEEFTVEEVHKIVEEDTDTEYTEIILKHLQMNSTHNCFVFSRSPAAVSTLWLVLALTILSSFYLLA